MILPDIVLCAPRRTAIGKFNGTLAPVSATDLGARVIAAVMADAKLSASQIDGAVMGNVVQAGNKMNPARQAVVNAGLGDAVPAVTVNRVCGSGAEAIAAAAREIWLGHTAIMIAGGMENMDRAPYLLPNARFGYRMGPGEIQDSMLLDGLHDAFSGEHSGWHTEDLITEKNISRDDQDRWAARSHQNFAARQQNGAFEGEITAIEIAGKKGTITFDRDESVRPETSMDVLAKLRPVFRPDGTITAGNAPGLNSGAAAMIVANRDAAEKAGLRPMARLVSYGVAAVAPAMFGIAPVPAVQQALYRAGWQRGDIDRIEINEAYAAVPLAVLRELDLPEDIVNVDGGAIAHGHPIGATGAVLTTRLIHSMQCNGLKRGIVTLCIGGGQGIALALEIIS